MRNKRSALFAVAICMMLSGCGQHHVHMEDTVWSTAPLVTTTPENTDPTESIPMETMPEETLPEETAVPETEAETLQPVPDPEDHHFVNLSNWLPGIAVELKYATKDNFTGNEIYSFDACYLRYGTVKKLMAVQAELEELGYGLKIWDGFRPVSAQFALWEICPDPTYVANPETGFSSHSRGNTVDLTLVDSEGREVVMPTGFDDFSPLADRDYSDCPEETAENARFLQGIMEKYGFTGYFGEWWHFSDAEKYEVERVFDPALVSVWYADCEEFISLRAEPSTAAEVLTRIPVGREFILLGYTGDFSMVSYRGLVGYVLTSYTSPVETKSS